MSAGTLRAAMVVVLVLDAVLLALTELAWLTLATPGGTWIPAAVVGALVTTPLLVRLADYAAPRTRAPLAPLVAWTAAIVVVGAWGPSGAGVLPADYRALLLVAAGLLPGVVALVWRPAKRPPAPEEPADEPADAPPADASADAPAGGA